MIERRTFLFGAACLLTGVAPASAGLLRRSSLEPVTASYGPARLDIYAPAGAADLPVVFWVHGGGWRIGNRRHVDKKPEFFTDLGCVFVSIDYRMLPKADVATQAKDVEAAFVWVRDHIVEHGGDPRNIVAMGHSAGCHLVALTGLRGGLDGVGGLILDDVEAYDLEDMAAHGRLRHVYAEAFSDPGQWKALSPITYAERPGQPPVLIAWSRVNGHEAAAHRLADRLRRSGASVGLFDGSAYSHGQINRLIGEPSEPITQAVAAFAAACLDP